MKRPKLFPGRRTCWIQYYTLTTKLCQIKVRCRSTQRLARHSDQRVDRHVLLQRAKRLGAKEPAPASCHIRKLTNMTVVYAPYSLQSTDVTLLHFLSRVESQVAAPGPTWKNITYCIPYGLFSRLGLIGQSCAPCSNSGLKDSTLSCTSMSMYTSQSPVAWRKGSALINYHTTLS